MGALPLDQPRGVGYEVPVQEQAVEVEPGVLEAVDVDGGDAEDVETLGDQRLRQVLWVGDERGVEDVGRDGDTQIQLDEGAPASHDDAKLEGREGPFWPHHLLGPQ